ncbi:hypothetical protein F5X68DRAFT_234438 [Plectosphaerella plurivora]|uniref:Uncharacterized protein n=1 Tax=Plectosphaerella plurivora TaxID=936078 RepID=A0A9P8V7Z1_9PEZI|nr:hypothetical protein F5X68DRAFT_234438 [Plectosphaerella plurivora]
MASNAGPSNPGPRVAVDSATGHTLDTVLEKYRETGDKKLIRKIKDIVDLERRMMIWHMRAGPTESTGLELFLDFDTPISPDRCRMVLTDKASLLYVYVLVLYNADLFRTWQDLFPELPAYASHFIHNVHDICSEPIDNTGDYEDSNPYDCADRRGRNLRRMDVECIRIFLEACHRHYYSCQDQDDIRQVVTRALWYIKEHNDAV